MRNGCRFAFVLMALCALLIITGCAKKAVEQTKEIAPPQTGVTTEQPGSMQMETPKTGGESVAQPQTQGEDRKTTLEQQMASFEENDIYFDFDRFDLTPEARKTLADKARFLNTHPKMKIRIEGYSDERGTQEYNLALGERRAKAALDYLVFLGIGPERIATISYGEEKPLDPGHDETAWAKNRRAHFDIL